MPTLPIAAKCYGCAACSSGCPTQSIQMETNIDGEQKPVINISTCVECGKCMKICPALRKPDLYEPLAVYAMTFADDNMRRGSASGGAARALYESVLDADGTVFGCEFDKDYILWMHSASSHKEIEGFRNSKYTYCRMGKTYQEIERLLKNEKLVLFTGSSCQVDALKSYLGHDYENLITVDLICHGVPPERYLLDYLQEQEKIYKTHFDTILFRGNDKLSDFHIRLASQGQVLYDKFAREDKYFAGYVNCAIFEEKCYHCPYATCYRVADISIGDWGGPSKLSRKKLSLVFACTEKGVKVLSDVISRDDICAETHTIQEAVACNEQLHGTSKIPVKYESMRACYREQGYRAMTKQYIHPFIVAYRRKKRRNTVEWLIRLPGRITRKIIRRVLRK